MKNLKVIYVYDPLCGWCYGFSPVMKKFYKKFRNKLDFEVISGGMVVGERIGPIGKVAPYIKDAYKVVEERTGVTFGRQFLKALDEGSMIFSSIPPSRALTAFKVFRPNDAILMAHELQKSIYYDGKAPGDGKIYSELAKKFELPVESYEEALWSDNIASKTEQEFVTSGKLGVSGFPTVFIGNKEKLYPISRGYIDYDEFLMNAINAAAYFGEELV